MCNTCYIHVYACIFAHSLRTNNSKKEFSTRSIPFVRNTDVWIIIQRGQRKLSCVSITVVCVRSLNDYNLSAYFSCKFVPHVTRGGLEPYGERFTWNVGRSKKRACLQEKRITLFEKQKYFYETGTFYIHMLE